MRLQRHKMGADDFELLTMIGKGAFGEVMFLSKTTMFLFIYSVLFSTAFLFAFTLYLEVKISYVNSIIYGSLFINAVRKYR